MKKVLFVVVLASMAVWPVATDAWGMAVHRLITGLALDGLPLPLRTLYTSQRAFVVEHSVDPDLWRLVGLGGELGPEDPNHFLDIDGLDEPPPFTNVPRDHAAFVARYGKDRAEKAGRLPWRGEEVYGRLVNAFKAMSNGSTYGADNARYLSAIMAHYVEDAHQPMHAVANYDGQLTNQRGIHSRFETELPLRYWSRMPHPPAKVQPVTDIKTYLFDTLVKSQSLVAQILDADTQAAAGLSRDANNRLVYTDAYYAKMDRALRSMLQQRLAETVNGVASVIVAAWRDGGSPGGR
jgi:hypothetical protein